MIHKTELLARYDEEMRRDAYVPGLPVQRLPEVSRYYDPQQREVLLMWHHFAAADAERLVARELAFFAGAAAFTWKVYAEDEPASLPSVLAAAGLKAEGEAALMVCPVDALCAQPDPDPRGEVRTLKTSRDIELLRHVWEQVWPGDNGGWPEVLAGEIEHSPERVRILVSCVAGEPVSAGYIVLDPRGTFGYLGGGSTIARERGRGHYRRLVFARAALAAAAGIRYLAVEASAQSQPVLAKLGFTSLTTLRFFTRG